MPNSTTESRQRREEESRTKVSVQNAKPPPEWPRRCCRYATGKQPRGGGFSASLLPSWTLNRALSTVRLGIDGVQRSALVDRGCSMCVAHVGSCKSWRKRRVSMITVDGKEWRCRGYGVVCLESAASGRVTVVVILARRCCRYAPGKQPRGGGFSASLLPSWTLNRALSTVRLGIDGVQRSALVDRGCSMCVAHVGSCKSWRKRRVSMITVDGKEWRCRGYGVVCLESAASGRVTVVVILADMQPLGFDFILGMNGITAIGGVSIDGERRVRFGGEDDVRPRRAFLDRRLEMVGRRRAAVLKNYVGEHPPAARARAQYEEEDQPDQAPYLVGDKVWVRPPDVRCDSEYQSGTITASLPRHAVYVDGPATYETCVAGHLLKNRPVSDCRQKTSMMIWPGQAQRGWLPWTRTTKLVKARRGARPDFGRPARCTAVIHENQGGVCQRYLHRHPSERGQNPSARARPLNRRENLTSTS
ncbi:hypothetical protein M514_13233 [Trichuris suis]|uniref:Uncharacterized protein n=1 Tax=Trichuris suis TaxID=68888 RepID=A0A085MSB1_9BILA|nr:hypothetical protein M514_13233 [Trichuris suis]